MIRRIIFHGKRGGFFGCLFFLFFSVLNFPQSEFSRWEKVNVDYVPAVRSPLEDSSSGLVSFFVDAYHTLLSDVDGDNCPFEPSCSYFFLQSVQETNILAGTILFFDRFTRDMNPVKSFWQYELTPNRKRFFDPPARYLVLSTPETVLNHLREELYFRDETK